MPSRTTRYDTLAAARGWNYRGNGGEGGPLRGQTSREGGSGAWDPERIFGENTFGMAEMQARMPKPAFRALMATIERGATLDPTSPTPSRSR